MMLAHLRTKIKGTDTFLRMNFPRINPQLLSYPRACPSPPWHPWPPPATLTSPGHVSHPAGPLPGQSIAIRAWLLLVPGSFHSLLTYSTEVCVPTLPPLRGRPWQAHPTHPIPFCSFSLLGFPSLLGIAYNIRLFISNNGKQVLGGQGFVSLVPRA